MAMLFAAVWRTKRLIPLLAGTGPAGLIQSPEDDDPRTVIERVEGGWWHTAALDGGKRIAAFLSETRSEPARWHEYLARTRYVSRYSGVVLSGPTVRAANSQHLEPVCGDGWLAAGDAAMALDPLSGQGIVAALRCGIFAGYAAGDWLVRRDENALARYQRFIAVALENYQCVRRRYYDSDPISGSSPRPHQDSHPSCGDSAHPAETVPSPT
jgi:flavin-dependent dehydrogenase